MRGRVVLAAVFAALFVLGASLLPAQELTISAGAGRLFPADDYRAFYGRATVFAGDVWLKLKGRMGVASGLVILSDKGTAFGGPEDYLLSFRRASIPLVAFYELRLRPVSLRIGAGGAYHLIRETWRGVDLSYRGHAISPRVVLALSVPVAGRLSVFAAAAYDPIHAGAEGPLVESEHIGGFQVTGGLLFRLFSR